MLPDIQPGNTKILYFFNCLLDGMHTILPGLCDFTYSVPNPVKPQSLDESFIRCYGRLGHLGDSEWRTETDHRVHRERNHDGAV